MTREYTPLLVFHETESESHPFSSTPKANCLSKVVNINDKSRKIVRLSAILIAPISVYFLYLCTYVRCRNMRESGPKGAGDRRIEH